MATAFGYPAQGERAPERGDRHPAHDQVRHAAIVVLAGAGALLFSVGDQTAIGPTAIAASVTSPVPVPVPSADVAAFDASLDRLRDARRAMAIWSRFWTLAR